MRLRLQRLGISLLGGFAAAFLTFIFTMPIYEASLIGRSCTSRLLGSVPCDTRITWTLIALAAAAGWFLAHRVSVSRQRTTLIVCVGVILLTLASVKGVRIYCDFTGGDWHARAHACLQ